MMHLRRLILAAACFAPAGLAAQVTPTPARVASSTSADDPSIDAAITQLTNFLAKYPNSPLRPNALVELGELLVRKADADFAATQRSGTAARPDAPDHADYGPAIVRFEEVVKRYPDDKQVDAAAYTLGTLYFATQGYQDAVNQFSQVAAKETSPYRAEAFFRMGDSHFELAARQQGEARKQTFAKAAEAYKSANTSAPKNGDIYFLSLYKLGWSYYNQATARSQDEYQKAVETFGRLVSEYDKLSPEQQSRLGLRGEALEYMAIALTQLGGAEAVNTFFKGDRSNETYKLALYRRVANSLRDQGDFPKAVAGYRAVIAEAPADPEALRAQQEIVDILQNQMQSFDQAQAARLELVEKFAPGSPWALANPSLATELGKAREGALRQAGQYALSQAQRGDRPKFAEAAALYGKYMQEFAQGDSAQAVNNYYAFALEGAGDYKRAGQEYQRTAYSYRSADAKRAQEAGQNAIVAFDSALVRAKTDRGAQDALFGAVDKFVAAFPETDIAKKALITKGRRASEAQRWDVMAETFRTYASKYPNDAYTPSAQKLIGDALYRQGNYSQAQQQWEVALNQARTTGKKSLADSLVALRTSAAVSFADTLVKGGDYKRAAEEVYVAFADKNPQSDKAPEALRNAIETYMTMDSVARGKNDATTSQQARARAIELSGRLVTQYPSYKYRQQYQSLRATLLADVGRRDEAVEALRTVIRDNPSWSGRADAMVRLATTLDSLGRKTDAAAAYEQFAAAFPSDKRAADAQYNAAATYAEANENAASARAFQTFAAKFPRDPRASEALQKRVSALRIAGDTSGATRELTKLCAAGGNNESLKATCAAYRGEAEFRLGQSRFAEYKAMKLSIPRAAQLTRAGVDRASLRKRELRDVMRKHYEAAIKTGSPEWLAAASYYLGLSQWEYGDFLKNVQLPKDLTDAQRAAAQAGSAQQAEQYYDAAKKIWQGLIDKADQDKISSIWVNRAKDAIGGNVPAAPPSEASRDMSAPLVVGGVS
ncbi:MAG: tetratricopeptide repeat protein [Gemmatimonadota bacterium]|nr:tetratricopeptide repeat protein [Gemmatimonadota bacterium]